MKKIFIITFVLALSMNIMAKPKAREILDATKAKIEKTNGVRGSFTVTTFQGTKPNGTISGSLTMRGNKYTMTTPDMCSWFDGKTQWTYMKSSDEVSMTTPTQSELQQSSPSAFLSLYQKGYKITSQSGTLRGKKTWEVTLKAENRRQQPSVIKADIEQETYTLLCLRVQNNGDWTRIAIHDYKDNQNLPENSFTFNQKDFPTAEVIDMR